MLNDVKLLLGIDSNNTDLDDKLNLIISNACKAVLALMPSSEREVPSELEYIVVELSVARFNRLNNEGMSSYSQDGESITYSDDDMAPYRAAILSYVDSMTGSTYGKVRFL